jgi:hypothetical protein
MSEILENTLARLTAFISQNYTDIETGPGSVINELLLKLAAAIQNKQYNTIAALDQGAAIDSVLGSAGDSYSPAIDLIASNYNTVRSAGTHAQGRIKVTVSADNNYSLQAGLLFTQPSLGLNYELTADTRVSSDPRESLSEIQLYEDQGLYYFLLPVQAAVAGPEYQVSSGTVFSLDPRAYIADLVKLEAYGSFTTGAAVDTDKQLIAKIKYNLGNTRFGSAAGILNFFTKAFPNVQTLSICGANDAEMVRSKRNALGIATFGKADVYVRSSLAPETKHIVKQATKVAEDTWLLDMHNSDIPGFYNIKSIIPVTPNVNLGGTLVPTQTDFGYSLYNDQRCNDINSFEEARFTKYQTAAVTFTYSESPKLAINSTADFEIYATHQPSILDMQNLLLSDNERLACADYLVKAVIPCMVSLNIKLLKKKATDTFESLDIQQLKKDIFLYINTIPFGEELQASNIIDICHNYNIKRVDLPIEMTGVILCPDGSTLTLEDSDVLTIPYNLAKGVTPKTTLYFIDYYRVENGVINPIDNIGLSIV